MEGTPLLDQPWCSNWKEVIFMGEEPINKLPSYLKGNRSTVSKKFATVVNRAMFALIPFSNGDDNINNII